MGRSATSVESSIVSFAGIDYHKKFSVVCLGDAAGNVVGQHKLMNDEFLIRSFFAPYRGIKVTVESCRGYEWFVELLRQCGLDVSLCNPRHAKLIVQSKCKTDKLDSKHLMQLLAKGYLPTCYIPTAEEKSLREWLRWRATLVQTTSRFKIQIHALLDKENKSFGAQTFTKKMRPALKNSDLSPSRKTLLARQIEALELLEAEVKCEDKLVERMSKENKIAQLLETIPGIGPLTALMLIAEVGAPGRFRNAGQVSSYFGLVPREGSSAEKRMLGSITKEGSSMMRWMLVQCAWKAVSLEPEFARRFAAIRKRQGKQVAVVAVARLLAEIAWHVMRDGQPFDARKLATRN